MARFLALDWDHNQLHVVAATVSGSTVRIQRAAVWQESQSPNPAEAPALGRLLRERLKAAGIAPAPVLACIGRDRVILKEVRHPAVPPAEEPALVRFQAIKELTEPPDEVVIDYTPAGSTGNGGERRALVLVVRKELLQGYQTLCQAAGLKLAALTPRPFGLAACPERLAGAPTSAAAIAAAPLPPEVTGEATVAVLTLAEHWAEFCVVRGHNLLLARSVTAGPGLAGEIRRNLAVHAGQTPQHPIRAVYLAGAGEHEELRARLQDMLGLPVYAFDPFNGEQRPGLPATGRGGFAGAVGLLHLQARGAVPINFVRIKQAESTRDPNQRRLFLAAAAVLLAVGLGVAWCWGQLNAADVQLAQLTQLNGDLDRQLVPVEEDAKYLKALGDWDEDGVVWLDELYDLTDRFPSDPNLRLTDLQGIPITHNTNKKEPHPHVASLTLIGIATDDGPPQKLLAALNEDSRFYRVNPIDLTPNGGGLSRFQQFRRKFSLREDIEKRPQDDYTRRLPAAAAPGNQDRGGDFGDFGGFGQ